MHREVIVEQAGKAERQPDVRTQLDHLETAVARLEGRIRELRERLEPVLRSVPAPLAPAKEFNPKIERSTTMICPLSSEIERHHGDVSRLNDELDGIIGRLEV